MLKRLRRDSGVPVAKRRRGGVRAKTAAPAPSEEGDGSVKNPFCLALRLKANDSDCYFCLNDTCVCTWMTDALQRCYANLPIKRQTEQYQRRDLCAKSVLPPFVSRLVRLTRLTARDTFYDLGCGNGSVLFQAALMTGARCVGVEINPRNAQLAKEAWTALRPTLEARAGRPLNVEIICADFCELLRDDDFLDASPVIWAANMLLPKSVNHYLSERFRSLPVGTRIVCFDDFYPHSRSVAAVRDPEAFRLFDMTDYIWQPGSVEWCSSEGRFYMHTKKA